jgi:hypothetical protein
MQQLAAAAEHILTAQGLLNRYASQACRHQLVQLLQQVAGAATAAGRSVPWLPLIAALLQQQLSKLEYALQLRQQLQQQQQQLAQQLENAGQAAPAAGPAAQVAGDNFGDRSLLCHDDWGEGLAAAAAPGTGAQFVDLLPLLLGADESGEMRFDLAAYMCAADEAAAAAAAANAGIGGATAGGVVHVGIGIDIGEGVVVAVEHFAGGEASSEDDDDELPDLVEVDNWETLIPFLLSAATARIIALLECLMPLATSQQGLLALAPHVQLLQTATEAALPVEEVLEVPGPQVTEQQQQACRLWAKQTAAAALAELQQEHSRAYDQLCDEIIRSTAAEYSAAAQGTATQQQQQQQQQQQEADAVAAAERLAAATAEVTRLEHLLRLAGMSLDGWTGTTAALHALQCNPYHCRAVQSSTLPRGGGFECSASLSCGWLATASCTLAASHLHN